MSMRSPSFRTKECRYFKQGNCMKGDDCTYSHEVRSRSDTKECAFGPRCQDVFCHRRHVISSTPLVEISGPFRTYADVVRNGVTIVGHSTPSVREELTKMLVDFAKDHDIESHIIVQFM